MQFYRRSEKVEDQAKDQIEYPNEDPWIRRKFEEELGKRGLTSLIPAGRGLQEPRLRMVEAMGKQ